MHPDKTRLIRFGRHAAEPRARLGEGKPETFDFLGFTHFCTRSRKWGSFVIGRKTIKKRMRAKLKAIRGSCARLCTTPFRHLLRCMGALVVSVLMGRRTGHGLREPVPDRLKLKVNEAKSAVGRPQERKFLGFSISNDGSKRRIAPRR